MSYFVQRKELIFLTAITVYLAELFLHYTVLEENAGLMSGLKYVRYFCYALAVLKILMDCYNEKSIYLIIVVACLVAIMTLQTSSREFLFYLLMIIAAKDVDFRKIIKCACIVQGTLLAVFVLGAQMGWIENLLFLQTGGRYRYGLGFFYTSFAPVLFFFFVMSYLYLRKERMRIYEYIVLEAINLWFYVMTDTRFSFYLCTILLVFVFFMRFYWRRRKDRIRRNRWLVVTPAACCVGAILLQACYNPNYAAWQGLNQFFNNRLSLGWEAFHTYGVTLFGQDIQWIGWGTLDTDVVYNYVDCSYMQILLNNGIIFLILVIAMYTYMMYMAIRLKDYYLQTILLAILLFSITEPRLFNLAFNAFPLLIAAVFRTKPLEVLNCRAPALIRKWVA